MSTTETAVAVVEPKAVSTFGFDDSTAFAHMQRVAKMFSASKLVPVAFQGEENISNCVIALNMAKRMGADPLAVMQNLDVIYGRPSFRAQFIISCVNTCGRFSPLRFTVEGEGDKKTCTAWAIEKSNGEKLEGPSVSIQMAKDEGWHGKNGSKWKTMPDLMLRYRAATFFGRLYAPEILMGMQTTEELADIGKPVIEVAPAPKFSIPTQNDAPAEILTEGKE